MLDNRRDFGIAYDAIKGNIYVFGGEGIGDTLS